MSEFLPGITGKIPNDSVAKMIIRIASASVVLLQIVGLWNVNFFPMLIVFIIVPVLLLLNSRVAAVLLLLLHFVSLLWHLMVAYAAFSRGYYLALHLPMLSALVFWLLYRSTRAAFFIHSKKPKTDIQTIQEVFE